MRVGLIQVMQSFGYKDISDAQVYAEELKLAVRADQLGYDHVWVVEHHFEDYAFCPDNFVYLAHVAALTKRIGLATGAVIVPWNEQPLRVAEKAALLDHLSGGRVVLGLGRGLSRREYDRFGIDMNESRGRFDEAAPMILEALETGWMEAHEGEHFQQPRAPIRPAPFKSFKVRICQVAMSPESIEEAARLGAKMMVFNFKPLEVQIEEFAAYRAAFRRCQGGVEPDPPLLTDFVICDADAARAEENAKRYIATYLHSVMHHYELMGDHYEGVKGYEEYATGAEALRVAGLEELAKAYVDQQVWGTPDAILTRYEERRKHLGDTDALCAFRFAGMPFEIAERSLELFAKEVIPVLKKWERERSAA